MTSSCLALSKFALAAYLCASALTVDAQVVENREAGTEWIEPPEGFTPPPGMTLRTREFNAKTLRMFIADLQCDASAVYGQMPVAQNEIIALLRRQSSNPLVWAAEAELELRESKIDCGCGDSSGEMLEHAEKAVAMNPQSVEARLTAAKLNFLVGNPAAAQEHIKQAVAYGASKTDVAYVEALAAQYRHDDKANITWLAPIVAELGQSAQMATAYEKLGSSYWSLKQPVEAEKMYRKGAQLQACLASPQISLAEFLLFEKSDVDGAKNVLREAMERLPNPDIKRLLSVTDYYAWAAGRQTAKERVNIKELAQSAYASPEEVFVDAARFESGSMLMQKLLAAAVVKDIDARDGNNNTALIAAGMGNNRNSAMFLIGKHAAPDAENTSGQRALGFFSGNGNLEVVKLLLNRHANPDYVDHNGDSPLAAAVRGGHAELLQALLQARPTYKNIDLSSLLSLTALEDNKQMVSLLLSAHASVNPSSEHMMPPLIAAILSRNEAIVRLLLDQKADTNVHFNGRSAVDYARFTGDENLIKLIARVST